MEKELGCPDISFRCVEEGVFNLTLPTHNVYKRAGEVAEKISVNTKKNMFSPIFSTALMIGRNALPFTIAGIAIPSLISFYYSVNMYRFLSGLLIEKGKTHLLASETRQLKEMLETLSNQSSY